MKHSIKQIRDSKARSTGAKLGTGLKPEFGDLLDYSRGLGFDQIPNYNSWNSRFEDIAQSLGIISVYIWLIYMYFSCSQRLKQLNFDYTQVQNTYSQIYKSYSLTLTG